MKLKLNAADLLLIVTTMIWGWSFIIVKWSISLIDPFFFIFIRFLLALAVLTLCFFPKIKGHWRTCLKPGIFLGIILTLGFITQTLGLTYTTASASGFITGLNVILVAVFASMINRRLPRRIVLVGIICATVGLLLITLKGRLSFAQGDLLTLACALFFAIHVVYTDRLAQNLSAAILTLVQFATVTVLSGTAYLCFGRQAATLGQFSVLQWLALFYAGVPATALAYLFQTKAQQKIPAFRTAVLLATEPMFAGIFALSLGFDPFSWKVVAGGLLIVFGMICASWDTRNGSGEIPQGSQVSL
ncbi:MAG TPA: DMT family transporter [Bacillota bacterium]